MDRASDTEYVSDAVFDAAGEEAFLIVQYMREGETTDEELSQKTGIRINNVRRVLYRLYDKRLASYRRARSQETGWYVYYWTFHPAKAVEAMRHKKSLILSELKNQLDYERSNVFFHCFNDDCNKISFDLAAEQEFLCPQCGNRLEYVDNTDQLDGLFQRIEDLKTELRV